MVISSSCPFCNYDKNSWRENVYETKNFQIKIGIGIITAGHCMITSKNHCACMGELSNDLMKEFIDLKNDVISKITQNTSAPFLIEYGVFCQSVPHAHTHFIPSSSDEYSNVNIINEMLLPAVKKHNIPVKEINIYELQDIYNEDKQYIYFEQNGKGYALRTKGFTKDELQDDVLYRRFFINQKGIKAIKSWKEMTSEEQEKDNFNIEESKKILRFT